MKKVDFLAITASSPTEQAEMLNEFIGMDAKMIRDRINKMRRYRRGLIAAAATIESRLASTPKHEDVPETEIPLAWELSSEYFRQAARVATLEADIERMEEQLSFSHDKLSSAKGKLAVLAEKRDACGEVHDAGIEESKESLQEAEETNRKVRENAARQKIEDEKSLLQKQIAESTAFIEALERYLKEAQPGPSDS